LISNLKATDSDYDSKKKHIEEEWLKELSKMPYYLRPTQGDASETAIIKFFQPIEDIM
jgi:sodium/potassium-transporting ATPase subunit alpha